MHRWASLLTVLLVGAQSGCPPRSASAAPAAPPAAILHCGGPITAMGFSPDGRFLAVGTAASPDVQVWDTSRWRLRHSLRQMPALGGGQTGCGALTFLPDGRLATATDNVTGPAETPYAEVRLWSPGTGVLQQTLTFGQVRSGFCPPAITGLAASPDGRTLLGAAAPTSDLVCWDVRTKATTLIPSGAFALPPLTDAVGAFEAVAFSPDGRSFAARFHDQPLADASAGGDALLVWDAGTHSPRRFLPLRDGPTPPGLAYAPTGTLVATTGLSSPSGSVDGATAGVSLVDGRTGTLRRSIPCPTEATCLAFDPTTGAPAFGTATGDVFGIARGDGALLTGDTPRLPLLPSGGGVCALAISRAGLLAVGHSNGTVQVWHLSGGGKWGLRPAGATAEATAPGQPPAASGSPQTGPRPTLLRIDPPNHELPFDRPNAETLTLRVSGSGFVPGAVIQWGGKSLPTRFLSSTSLEATFAVQDVLPPSAATPVAGLPNVQGDPHDQSIGIPVLVRDPGGRPSRLVVFIWTHMIEGG